MFEEHEQGTKYLLEVCIQEYIDYAERYRILDEWINKPKFGGKQTCGSRKRNGKSLKKE